MVEPNLSVPLHADNLLKHHSYSVQYDTARLVTEAAAAIKARPDTISAGRITVTSANIAVRREGVEEQVQAAYTVAGVEGLRRVPDFLSELQKRTELTRTTLAAILAHSGRLGDALVNPQQFVELAAGEIEQKKRELLVQGVQYERLNGADSSWEMMWFRDKELEPYLNRIQDTPNRGLFDGVECDSEVERRFAEKLDERADIKLFVKLPWWFKVETPVGDYNPDWAIVKEVVGEPPRLYLVRETKGTDHFAKLDQAEKDKITCGKQHFKALGFAGNGYEWTDSAAKV